VLVGAWNTFMGYGLFALFTWLLTDRVRYAYMVAGPIAHVISVSVAFVGHRHFVFRSAGNWWAEFAKCHLVYLGVFLVSYPFLPLMVILLRWLIGPLQIVPYLAGAALVFGSTIVSYFGHKNYSFAGAKDDEPAPGALEREPSKAENSPERHS